MNIVWVPIAEAKAAPDTATADCTVRSRLISAGAVFCRVSVRTHPVSGPPQ